jgi:hypothetical protein
MKPPTSKQLDTFARVLGDEIRTVRKGTFVPQEYRHFAAHIPLCTNERSARCAYHHVSSNTVASGE